MAAAFRRSTLDRPEVKLISEIKDDASFIEIRKLFGRSFGELPSFFVRVPGRINLIGEHIDYCGFSVLPMAIDRDIIIGVGRNNTNTISLVNVDSDTYENATIPVDDLSIDTSNPQWYHYVICGYRGIAENHGLIFKGLNMVVKGSIPPNSGLSSSSALVCASALAISYLNSILLAKMKLASICAKAEHYIGTEGGGMDQAIAFLAKAGTAKLIQFNPLKATDVSLPEKVVFVVCNSCVVAKKASSHHFNNRVAECKVAAKVLAKMHGLNWKEIERLSDLPPRLDVLNLDMMKIIKEKIPMTYIERAQVCKILEISEEVFSQMLSKGLQRAKIFPLRNRAIHVFEEAARVEKFQEICALEWRKTNEDEYLKKLGQLMIQSHDSLRELFDCIGYELQNTYKASLAAGAVGSKVTGAGFGGCIVSMVVKKDVEKFMKFMKKNYYLKRQLIEKDTDINTVMFETKPSNGACVYTM